MQKDHIDTIFNEYTTPSRVLRSFTNLSNTVIQTALSGQSKFVFEILQNADDAFENTQKEIEVQFILQDNYLIVHHNGKGFDYNDVERICDYASQIEEVKATDLSKTGYKGLGFKSLFNLSDCIYIYSNGYSFRFDKSYWSDPESRPWQIIPIWCKYGELPLHKVYSYDQPVNFILKLNDINQIESQLREVIEQPELLLYLYRINKLSVHLNREKHSLERKVENFELFDKVEFYANLNLASTWISKTYYRTVPKEVKKLIQGASKFIYPDKIKKAKEVPFTFALRSDSTLKEILRIRGICYSTLPTQLHLTLPYHVNSVFILNLDRTQLHENEWNEFLIYQVGQLQLSLLKDLAGIPYLKNYVIELLVRRINHPYTIFTKAFLKGFTEVKFQIGWLPAHQESRLLTLGKAWTDEIEFFKQNFQTIRDHKIYPHLIHYDVKGQNNLLPSEAEVKRFTYEHLFRDFPKKYYPQLTRHSYINFISYLHERLKIFPSNHKVMGKLKIVPFLVARNRTLVPPKHALLEESENPIPDFSMLNPIDNDYLPSDNILIKDWLARLGARRLRTPAEILRATVLEWIGSGTFEHKINMKNHIEIINYLAKNVEHLTEKENERVKENLLILTEGNQFKLAKLCYLPDAVSITELADIISNDEKVSSLYNIHSLKDFFIHMKVHNEINPIDVFRKSILMWIKSGEIRNKLNVNNYYPIIEYAALHYPSVKHNLTEPEKNEIKKIHVLTCGQIFQRAQNCYFDSAIPSVKGLEYTIARDKLILKDSVSKSVYKFLSKIGVSESLQPIEVIRKSVLKWIHEGDITKRITIDNHLSILVYIAQHWVSLKKSSELKSEHKEALKRIPILTNGNTFRAACECYWPPSDSYHEEIPGLEHIISPDEFVSSVYPLDIMKGLLEDLGVHNISFTDIYEKYSNYLTHRENVKWFFSSLIDYWGRESEPANKDKLLTYLQRKFKSSPCLLAKNNRKYYSTQLYSSLFIAMHDIDQNSVPVLAYEILPEDLERWLGFKTDLDLKCIIQLLKAVQKKPDLGDKNFFTTVLEQLRRKDIHEIKMCQLSLLSKDNKIKPAKDLYYFNEEDATCVLDSCYLKRVHGMSHDKTLELAKLCGVNVLPFEQEVERQGEIYDDSLRKFYLERLPFIAVQESREINESPSSTLKRLYDEICSIKLYQCRNIYVQYPFGNPIEIRKHFYNLTLYVLGKWTKWEYKSKIHEHIRKRIFKTDIMEIIDMDPNSMDDKQAWLRYLTEEDRKIFYLLEEELQKLLSNQEKVRTLTCLENVKVDQPYNFRDEEVQYLDELNENKQLTASQSSSDESSIGSAEDESELWTQYSLNANEFINAESSSDESSVSSVKEVPELISQYAIKFKELITAESSSSDESSACFVVDEPRLQTQKVVEAEAVRESDTFIDEPGAVTCSKAKTVRGIGEDISEADTGWLIPSEPETDLKTRIQIEVPGSSHNEKTHTKWLSEKCVFTFLQDHYKNKHPSAQCNLSNGQFTLQWKSHKIEIIWLNEKEEKGDLYDLLLKKDDEVKRLIEVKSTNTENEESFQMGHYKCIEKLKQLAKDQPKYKEKYCMYRVVNVDNSSLTSFEKLNSLSSIYKVVPMKYPCLRKL